MPLDRYLIAPINSGLETDKKSWLIPDDAYASLQNAYVFRGRLRKRFGSSLMGTGWDSANVAPLYSRVAVYLGVIAGDGSFSGTVPGIAFNVGQQFFINSGVPANDTIFTVVTTGTPGVLSSTSAATGTYNTSTGALVIAGGSVGAPLYFYPAQPIMGITIYESGGINNEPSYAFDTQFAYTFANGYWLRSGTAIWAGGDTNFVWTANWRGATSGVNVLFASNYNLPDPIWWTVDGTNWTSGSGTNAFYFFPNGGAVHTGPYVKTARIIVPFKNRLLLLSTIENDNSGGGGVNTYYQQRCRFSAVGSPFTANAWYEPNQTDSSGNNFSGASFIDASTQEQIVSAEFIKDRLIVYFQSSTWEIAYTQNELYPFVWQKINTELGAESPQSTVPFDTTVLAIGNVGVHSCSGANVSRIDTKIPQKIFEISNRNSGFLRVAGIRDYYAECVYWSFPSLHAASSTKFPNRVLVYNYENDTWAFNDDCITAFGYFEQQPAITWQNSGSAWDETSFSWESGDVQTEFKQVIAGNQQGYIFIINADVTRNASAMQLTAIAGTAPDITLTIIDHTLVEGDYILIENCQGTGLTGVNDTIFQIVSVASANTVKVQIDPLSYSGTYLGGGTISRVSNYDILTKRWNPYVNEGRNFYLARIDFAVQKTSFGEVTVDYYTSSSEVSNLSQGVNTGSIMGNGTLETSAYSPVYYPLEQFQDLLWHPIYFQSSGEFIQLNIYMSDEQIRDVAIAVSDFQIEGMILHTEKTSARLQ